MIQLIKFKSINLHFYSISSNLLEKVYPIGSIYLSVNSTNPGTLFGGTWVAWGAGRVPVGVDPTDRAFDTVEKKSGEQVHVLTQSELPSHNHGFGGYAHTFCGSGGTWGPEFTHTGNASNTNATGIRITLDTGGNAAHNNLQPYITCYMWKRTA